MDDNELRDVLHAFRIEPVNVQLLKQVPDDRAIWKVTAVTGEAYALKRFYFRRRAEKTAVVSRHLAAAGVPVVPTLPTRRGGMCIERGNAHYVLFPWLPGRVPVYQPPGMIGRVAGLLARFHQGSRGLAAAHASQLSWGMDWNVRIATSVRNLERAAAQAVVSSDGLSRLFVEHLSWMRARAGWVVRQLPGTGVAGLMAAALDDPLLLHGDYSRVNLIEAEDGALTIIDLDAAHIALPVWDLSRLIGWINHDLGDWSDTRLQAVLGAYETVRPLSDAERELLLVDQVFPHLAVDIVREHYRGSQSPTLLEELTRCLATDRMKLASLGIGPRDP